MPRNLHITYRKSVLPKSIEHLWALRMLVPLGGHQTFVNADGVLRDDLAISLGLGEWLDASVRPFDAYAFRGELRRRYATFERTRSRVRYPEVLERNLRRLGRIVALSEVDREILAFCVCLKTDILLEDAAHFLGNLSSAKVFHALAVATNMPESAVRASLSGGGTLGRTGLVSVVRHRPCTLDTKLDLLSDGVADYLTSCDEDSLSSLLREIARPAPDPLLTAAHFDHVADSLRLLRPYLAQVLEAGRRGVNIFIYGRPGTGKTQLAAVVAQDLGCELLEVSNQDRNGDAVSGERRLRAYRCAQNFFARRRALILFDEAEDVFIDGGESAAQARKAWMNSTLEQNEVPTLWLSNSVRCLDPAFARRFDMIIEVPVPPKRQRESVIREACGNLLLPADVSRIAEHDALAPALIARAASVVKSMELSSGADASHAVEHVLNGILMAQGHRALPKTDPGSAGHFDPAFIHADTDLSAVAEGIARSGYARLCLYGPPGTGKTAYAHWLAARLGVPVHERHASDLLSSFVGGTERNLARAFREAEREQALLLLDEVDSFLQDRRHARATWEVTGVNEMLTQLERFRGVLVATTNLVEGLDQAAMRRFDLKAKLDFLRLEQSWQLLLRHSAMLGLAAPGESAMSALAALDCVTPGDFAAVVRQHRFRPAQRVEDLLAALEHECRFKEGRARRPPGFL